jgi:hypothetical protein
MIKELYVLSYCELINFQYKIWLPLFVYMQGICTVEILVLYFPITKF